MKIYNIADIAYALGFEYPTYFNNFFKKRQAKYLNQSGQRIFDFYTSLFVFHYLFVPVIVSFALSKKQIQWKSKIKFG